MGAIRSCTHPSPRSWPRSGTITGPRSAIPKSAPSTRPSREYPFALPHLLGLRTAFALKTLFLFFDLGNVLLLSALLARLGRPRTWVLIYAWSPLALKEFTNSGHLDPVMLFFLLLSLRSVASTPMGWTLVRRGRGRETRPPASRPALPPPRGGTSLAWAAGLFALLSLPFLTAGPSLFSGAGIYAHYWTFNPGLYALLRVESALLPHGRALPLSPARLSRPPSCSPSPCGAPAAWTLNGLSKRSAPPRDTLAVGLFLSPTVDPWYVCWLLPFLALAPSAGLLVFTVTCNLSYLYYAHRRSRRGFPSSNTASVGLAL